MAKLSDITKSLEAAVDTVAIKKASLDAARLAVTSAENEYQSIVNEVKQLHGQYQAIMADIFSLGGTIHTKS